MEQELAQLQHSFHQRLAGDRSAGELMVARSSIQSPSFGGEDFSARSAVADVDGAPSGTPRQRVYAAERRYERRLETQAREQESATRIQAIVRGRRARAQARTKLARKRDVRTRCLLHRHRAPVSSTLVDVCGCPISHAVSLMIPTVSCVVSVCTARVAWTASSGVQRSLV